MSLLLALMVVAATITLSTRDLINHLRRRARSSHSVYSVQDSALCKSEGEEARVRPTIHAETEPDLKGRVQRLHVILALRYGSSFN